jgi:hypothetical protein
VSGGRAARAAHRSNYREESKRAEPRIVGVLEGGRER